MKQMRDSGMGLCGEPFGSGIRHGAESLKSKACISSFIKCAHLKGIYCTCLIFGLETGRFKGRRYG